MDFITTLIGLFSGGSGGGEDLLPGKVFTPIAAAFATQGYFAHAEILDLLAATSFQHYAVFVYMCAIIMALCGMALGSPPKFYLWFIMGPVVFHFLVGTTQDVYGNAWAVAGEPQEQNEVWKLVEAGMTGSPFLSRSGVKVTANGGPSQPVAVSWFFAKLDGLISDTVQELTKWLGVYTKGGTDGTATADSNITKAPTEEKIKWYLLSNLKWGFLDTITSARLSSTELRDSFITFLAGSCGDAFYASIDDGRFGAASRSTDGSIPRGIFRTKDSTSTGANYTSAPLTTYEFLNGNLISKEVAVPISMRRLLLKGAAATGSGTGGTGNSGSMWRFRDALPKRFSGDLPPAEAPVVNLSNSITYPAGTVESLMFQAQIKCHRLLDLIMLGFRWEAAQVYGSLALNTPSGLGKPDVLDYVMLHGWDVRIKEDPWKAPTANDIGGFKLEGVPLDTTAKRREYLVDLILVNMLKNEFLLAPNPHQQRLQSQFTSAQQAASAVDTYQKTVGQKNKFGEVYTWAKMMPYLQGVLLYILAVGYPFACIFVLIPGWHKIIFTWSSFWIWAKIWDLGFAIVVVLEKSIWATIGNSAKASKMNPFIAQMWNWGETQITNWTVIPIPPFGFAPVPLPPEAWKITLLEKAISGTSGAGADKAHYLSYMYLDRAMTLFSNMDLDLQNSYYIYIMAALYFAVPAVTGQLVLGAKAGVAGLVTNAFTQMAQETGAKAGAAFSADLQQRYNQAQSAADQAFKAKELQNRQYDAKGNPLTAGAWAERGMTAEFNNAMGQMDAAAMKQQQEGLQARGSIFQNAARLNEGKFQFANTLSGLIASGYSQGSLAGYFMAGLNPSFAARAAQSMNDIIGGVGDYKNMSPAQRREALNMTAAGQLGGYFDSQGRGPNPEGIPGPNKMGGGVSPEGIGKSQSNKGGSAGSNGETIPVQNNGMTSYVSPGAPDAVKANSTPGLIKQSFDKLWQQTGYGVKQYMTGGYNAYSDIASAAFSNFMTQQQTTWARDLAADSSQVGIDGFVYGREAERQGIMASRSKSIAQGMLQDNVFYDKGGYSSQLAPTLSAMGVQVQGPGPKSDDYGYMTYGGLGGEFSTSVNGKAVDTAGFAFDGGFMQSRIGEHQSFFSENYGYGALQKLFADNEMSVGEAQLLGTWRMSSILNDGLHNPDGSKKPVNDTAGVLRDSFNAADDRKYLRPFKGHNVQEKAERPKTTLNIDPEKSNKIK